MEQCKPARRLFVSNCILSNLLLFGRKIVHATSVFDLSFLPEGPKGCLGICR